MGTRKQRFRLSDRSREVIAHALQEVSRVGDPACLPKAVRTVALVHAAQGVIDNGGLYYFFGDDFPSAPPYSVFISAYRVVGATAEADALTRAVGLFPFTEPHRFVDRRRDVLAAFRREYTERENPFEVLTHVFYRDRNVWRCLEAYIQANSDCFPEPGKVGGD